MLVSHSVKKLISNGPPLFHHHGEVACCNNDCDAEEKHERDDGERRENIQYASADDAEARNDGPASERLQNSGRELINKSEREHFDRRKRGDADQNSDSEDSHGVFLIGARR